MGKHNVLAIYYIFARRVTKHLHNVLKKHSCCLNSLKMFSNRHLDTLWYCILSIHRSIFLSIYVDYKYMNIFMHDHYFLYLWDISFINIYTNHILFGYKIYLTCVLIPFRKETANKF